MSKPKRRDLTFKDLPWSELHQAAFSGLVDAGQTDTYGHERLEVAAHFAAREVVEVLMAGGYLRRPLSDHQKAVLAGYARRHNHFK